MATTRDRDQYQEAHRHHLNSICNNNANLKGHRAAILQAHPYHPGLTSGGRRLAHTALGILHRGFIRMALGLLLLSTLTHIARNLSLALRGSRCINSRQLRVQPSTKGILPLLPRPSDTRPTTQIPLERRPKVGSSRNDMMNDP